MQASFQLTGTNFYPFVFTEESLQDVPVHLQWQHFHVSKGPRKLVASTFVHIFSLSHSSVWAYWFKQFSTFLISESISLQLTSNTVFCTSEKCYQTFLSFWETVSIFTRCTLITLSRIYVLPSSLETKLNFLHFNRRKWPDSLMAKGGRSGSTYRWVTRALSATGKYVHFRAFLSLSVVYVQKGVLLNCEKTLWREICDVWEEQNVCCMKAVSWRQHHAPESLRQS